MTDQEAEPGAAPRAAPRAKLVVSPVAALVDEPVSIRVTGLSAGDRVTLTAELSGWSSEAHFVAGADGVVDPAHAPSVDGTYTGVEPMGLFWSMAQEGPGPQDNLDPLVINLSASVNGRALGSVEMTRLQVADGVSSTEVRDRGLFGVLYEPPGPGPHPALLVLGGSSGGRPEAQAAMFASRGLAALALAYFNFETLPAALVESPLEYFGTAIAWLQDQPRIDPDRIGVVGESRGGELALLLGSTFGSLRAVVAYVPSGVVWGAIGAPASDPPLAAWSFGGAPIPFVTGTREGDQRRRQRMADHAAQGALYSGTPDFLEMLNEAADVEVATIAVENTTGPVLMISGGDDQMWPSQRLSEIAMNRLRESGHVDRYADEHRSYPGAGHLFSWPCYPTTSNSTVHAVTSIPVTFGGNPRYTAVAWEDSWKYVQEFLHTHL